MPIQVNEENGGKMLTIHVSGKLQKKDCEDLVHKFGQLVLEHGCLRIVATAPSSLVCNAQFPGTGITNRCVFG